MIKITLSLIILTLTMSVGFAQEQGMGMRNLALNQMFVYGQTLFERGDKAEAKNVFARICQLDPDYPEIQSYIRALGIRTSSKPIERKASQEEIVVKEVNEVRKIKEDEVLKDLVVENKTEPVVLYPDQDLKDQIALEKQSITQLTQEISSLHADIRTQAHE